MANETSGAYFTANAAVDKTAADKFIPEIWSDEGIASYEKNLKMAPLVKHDVPSTVNYKPVLDDTHKAANVNYQGVI